MFNATRNVTAFLIGMAIAACLFTGSYFAAAWLTVLAGLIIYEMRIK